MAIAREAPRPTALNTYGTLCPAAPKEPSGLELLTEADESEETDIQAWHPSAPAPSNPAWPGLLAQSRSMGALRGTHARPPTYSRSRARGRSAPVAGIVSRHSRPAHSHRTTPPTPVRPAVPLRHERSSGPSCGGCGEFSEERSCAERRGEAPIVRRSTQRPHMNVEFVGQDLKRHSIMWWSLRCATGVTYDGSAFAIFEINQDSC
jgi:hypothetical protein